MLVGRDIPLGVQQSKSFFVSYGLNVFQFNNVAHNSFLSNMGVDLRTPTGTRTLDSRIKSPLLCQLSYGGLVIGTSYPSQRRTVFAQLRLPYLGGRIAVLAILDGLSAHPTRIYL